MTSSAEGLAFALSLSLKTPPVAVSLVAYTPARAIRSETGYLRLAGTSEGIHKSNLDTQLRCPNKPKMIYTLSHPGLLPSFFCKASCKPRVGRPCPVGEGLFKRLPTVRCGLPAAADRMHLQSMNTFVGTFWEFSHAGRLELRDSRPRDTLPTCEEQVYTWCVMSASVEREWCVRLHNKRT